jgi:hypothetical protein
MTWETAGGHHALHHDVGEAELLRLFFVGVIVLARAREHPAAAFVHEFFDGLEIISGRRRERQSPGTFCGLEFGAAFVDHELVVAGFFGFQRKEGLKSATADQQASALAVEQICFVDDVVAPTLLKALGDGRD